jgi:hypothetical protein
MFQARHRPLNKHVYNGVSGNDENNLPMYQCPSDQGYPDAPPDIVDDSPRMNAERPMYDTVGNSYRGSLYCFIGDDGAFAIGPWGHRLSTIPDTARVILLGEPRFFNMVGLNGGAVEDPKYITGWHRRVLTDNLAFCDGSARSTLASGYDDVGVLPGMNLSPPNAALIARGPTWRFDVWPTPGARIWGNSIPWIPPYNFNTADGPLNTSQWPVLGAQRNLD